MKIIVLGSGVVGVTTAYYLARGGAEVVVLDRQPGPGLETSYANAGQVSPGYSTPWAAPGIPLKAMKWLFQRHAPLAVRPDGSGFQWRWMASLLANLQAHPARYVHFSLFGRDPEKADRKQQKKEAKHARRDSLKALKAAR